jgi:hypothetical protein
MHKARLRLNECLKLVSDIEAETHAPELVSHKIKLLKADIKTLLRIVNDENETVVEFPQASRAQ